MIELNISTALFLYLFFSVGVLLIAWIFFDMGTHLRTFASEEGNVWHCDICTNTYVNSKDKNYSKCPVCGSISEKNIK